MESETTVSVVNGSGLNEGTDPPAKLALTIAAHPDPTFVGQRLVLDDGEGRTLGRDGNHFGLGGLADRGLSRRHARIEASGLEIRVADLESRNGTHLNGRRVSRAKANPGDTLRLGNLLFLVHLSQRIAVTPRQPNLFASSLPMLHVIRSAHRAAEQMLATLIQGPPGVGKELVAREVHLASEVRGAFVPINCAALADGLVMSELFGHAKGAFSGATSDRRGLVAQAEGGTLFLDEVGDASPQLQAALLRLLEQGEYRRVGEERLRASHARVVAATHVPLCAAVEAGRFRQDLQSRLARWVIDIAPLSQRRVDIVELAWGIARSAGRTLSPDLMEALLGHDWSSNVRELQSVLLQTLAGDNGEGPAALSPELAARLSKDRKQRTPQISSLERRSKPSREEVLAAIHAERGNLRAAAQALGVGRASLYRWLAAWGISPSSLRTEEERRE